MSRYPKGSIVKARVTNLTDYGCFAEIAEGVEGLVHVSEMDHTNKNIHPSKVVQIGDEVNVMVLDVDEERRRISLGMKQTEQDPWMVLPLKYPVGTRIAGKVRNLTSFGAFVEIFPGTDGLVHISHLAKERVNKVTDVVNEGGDPATEAGVWVAISPTGQAMSLVAIGAYELVSTRFVSASYPPNTHLTSPKTGGNAGKLVAGTPYTDTIVGVVSRGVVDNGYGFQALAFWPYYLPPAP